MSRVRNKSTDAEVLLRKKLWAKGLRYRLHYKVTGSPDIAFISKKIAVFCDGDFWHGKQYSKEGKNYKPFWQQKIQKNMKRDRQVSRTLKTEGWTVIRFWRSDLLKSPNKCADQVASLVYRSN